MARSRVPFPTGIADVHGEWTSGSFAWGLWQTDWTPNESFEVWVADITGTEISDATYNRQAVAGALVDVTLPASAGAIGMILYDADDPDFGVLAGDETAVWLVLFNVGGSDADSAIVCAFAVNHVCDGVATADFPLPATGAHAVATTCSGVF